MKVFALTHGRWYLLQRYVGTESQQVLIWSTNVTEGNDIYHAHVLETGKKILVKLTPRYGVGVSSNSRYGAELIDYTGYQLGRKIVTYYSHCHKISRKKAEEYAQGYDRNLAGRVPKEQAEATVKRFARWLKRLKPQQIE